MLSILGVDTLIVTGCSTGHCVYATKSRFTGATRMWQFARFKVINSLWLSNGGL